MTAYTRGSRLWGALSTFALVTLIGCAALIIAGSNDQRRTAFSADVPAFRQVVELSSGEQVCQGPLLVQAPFGGVELFLFSPAANVRLQAMVLQGRRGVRLAAGQLGMPGPTTSPAIVLQPDVRAGVSATVCLINRGTAPVRLAGVAPSSSPFQAVIGGRRRHFLLSMVFLRAHSRSLMHLVPTAFGRAALFRPTWVGSWTFWLLLGLVLSAFFGVATALGLAIRADEISHRA